MREPLPFSGASQAKETWLPKTAVLRRLVGASATVPSVVNTSSLLVGEVVVPDTEETRTEYVVLPFNEVRFTEVVAESTDVNAVAAASRYSTL
jgi:hypothetical protein